MANTPQLEKSVWGFNPEQDFSDGGTLPKLFQFRVTMARYAPASLRRDGTGKMFFCAILRGEDVVTEESHDIKYRAAWLPRVFDDRIAGSVPTNDGPDVDDKDREPTAPISFFLGLGDGTKSIPKDVDVMEEYGGRFGMGTKPGKDEPWMHFCAALAQCGYSFDSPDIASLENLILTLEQRKAGTYTDTESKERDLLVHLPIDVEVAKVAKKDKAKTAAKKSKPPVEDEEEEEEEEEKPKSKSTAGKKKSTPDPEPEDEEEEPEDDEPEEDDDDLSPPDVLHNVIVRMLSKVPNKTLPEGDIMLGVRKDAAFRNMDVKSQKQAINAYNSREIFENSDVLHYDEDADTVKYKPAKK